MPKVMDIKAYWREIASKAGLEGDDLKKVADVIDNEKFAKAFTDGFKPLPDYSHDLDDVRNKTKSEMDAEHNDWYKKTKAQYDQYVAALAEIRNGNGTTTVSEGKGMTQEDIDKLVEAKLQASLESVLSRRDQAYLSFRDADFDHMKRFNKPMDRVQFEKTWKDHPEWGGDLYTAYEKWIAPEVDKARETEFSTKLEARYQEGIRDGYTRKQVPLDHQPKQFSPMFDRKEDVGKMSDADQERHSREAFFQGMADGK